MNDFSINEKCWILRLEQRMFCGQILRCTVSGSAKLNISSIGEHLDKKELAHGLCSSLPISQTMSGRKGALVLSQYPATLRAVDAS